MRSRGFLRSILAVVSVLVPAMTTGCGDRAGDRAPDAFPAPLANLLSAVAGGFSVSL